MIHRDIKPANMLIDGRGNLWLADFGLAHCQNQAGLTMTGDLVGTLRYMSPEQALAKRVVVDHRTDIYSLGATLYELLTGEPVFGGNDRQELLRQIAFDEPKSLKRHTKAIPAELETIVLKALAKNPADRYGTAKEVAEDLERFVKDEPIHARRPSLARRARGWCRRHRPMVTAMIVLWHAAVLGGGAFLYWQDRQRTATAQAVENDWTEAETFWKQKQWPKALPALERASGRLVGSGLTALQARVDARRRDVAMINKLENARMLNVTYYHDSNARDRGPVDLAYQSAFAGYGLDVTAMDKDEIVQRIRGSEIRDYLIGGLDAWAYTKDQMPRGNGQPLSDIAQMADQDPWRIRLRQLQRRKDRAALERLAELREAASQPPDTVARLAELLESSAQARRRYNCAARRNNSVPPIIISTTTWESPYMRIRPAKRSDSFGRRSRSSRKVAVPIWCSPTPWKSAATTGKWTNSTKRPLTSSPISGGHTICWVSTCGGNENGPKRKQHSARPSK